MVLEKRDLDLVVAEIAKKNLTIEEWKKKLELLDVLFHNCFNNFDCKP